MKTLLDTPDDDYSEFAQKYKEEYRSTLARLCAMMYKVGPAGLAGSIRSV